MKSPRENCEKQGCGKDHDTCQPYIEWKEWRKGIAEKRKADSETGGISRDHEMKYRKNLMRRKRRG